LHIEELVLHGFEPADRHRIADALGAELERLLGAGPGPFVGKGVQGADVVDAGSVAVAPGPRPENIATPVAGAISRALGQ
jgi:hypothetical protein